MNVILFVELLFPAGSFADGQLEFFSTNWRNALIVSSKLSQNAVGEIFSAVFTGSLPEESSQS